MASEYQTRREIEFADTDMAGIVHFSRYMIFMETAEHQFLRSIGTDITTQWNGDILSWPRVSVSCDYRRPARYGDTLDIRALVRRKGTKSVTYEFIFRVGEAEIARGRVTSVCCICNPGEEIRPIPIPPFIAEQIEEAPSAE